MASRQATTQQIQENGIIKCYSLVSWEKYREAVMLNVREWRPEVETLMFDNWCGGISIRATISEINNNESI